MSFLSNIFGNDEVVNKTVDGIYSGVDKIILTDEEKLDYKNKSNELFLKGAELKTKLLENYHPYKLVQRFISLLIIVPFVLVYLVAVGFLIYGDKDMSDALLKANSDILSTHAMLIIGFYFSGSILDKVRK